MACATYGVCPYCGQVGGYQGVPSCPGPTAAQIAAVQEGQSAVQVVQSAPGTVTADSEAEGSSEGS
jgi:hypothetical protein